MEKETSNLIGKLDKKMISDWFYDQINERGTEFLEARGQYDPDGNLVFPGKDGPDGRRAYYMANIGTDILEADEWANSGAPIPSEGYYLPKASKDQVIDACYLSIAFISFSSQPLPDTPRMTRLRAALCLEAVQDEWNFATMDGVIEDIAKDTNVDWGFDTPELAEAHREKVNAWYEE